MCITPPPSSGSRETAYVADGHKSEARAGQRRRPLTLFFPSSPDRARQFVRLAAAERHGIN